MKIIQLDRKPRKGDRLGFGEFTGNSMKVKPPTKATFTVVKCDGNLCWQLEDGKKESQPFIWFFTREQMFNQLAHRFVETKITHHCGDCGAQVDEFCPDHPKVMIESIVSEVAEDSSEGESQAQGCVSAPT